MAASLTLKLMSPRSRSEQIHGGSLKVEGTAQPYSTIHKLACQECSSELVLSILHLHAAQQNLI